MLLPESVSLVTRHLPFSSVSVHRLMWPHKGLVRVCDLKLLRKKISVVCDETKYNFEMQWN